MPFIYSTLTASQSYAFYERGGADLPRCKKKITIKGGANIATKTLVTPLGAVTHITDEELELLKTHKIFKKHQEKGFVKFEDTEKRRPTKKAVQDLEKKDKSAPKVPEDFEGKNGPQPTTEPSLI